MKPDLLNPVQAYPFLGRKISEPVPLDTFLPYLKKGLLFSRQWQIYSSRTPADQKKKIAEEQGEPALHRLLNMARERNLIQTRTVYGYYPCYQDQDSIIILHPESLETWYRLEFPRQTHPPFLCLADFIRSRNPQFFDIMGMMLVTTGTEAMSESRTLYQENSYLEYFLWYGLISLLTECLAEYWHHRMESDMIADSTHLDHSSPIPVTDPLNLGSSFLPNSPTHSKARRSQRFSFGYPVCPDLNDQHVLCDILGAGDIGVTLSDSHQLIPENSTTALVIFNENAHYFPI